MADESKDCFKDDEEYDTDRDSEQLKEISRIGTIANSTLDLDEVLNLILENVTMVLEASVGMIFLRDPDYGNLVWGASLGLSEEFVSSYKKNPIRPGEGLTGIIFQTGKSLYIPEGSSRDPRVARDVTRREDLHSFIGVPLFAGEDVVGVLNILTRPPHKLSADQVPFCTTIGTHVGLAIRNARLYAEQQMAKNKLEQESRLQEILIDTASMYINLDAVKVDATIRDSLEKMGRFVNADRAYVFEYDFYEDTTSNTYEWCNDGITPQIDHLQKVPLEHIPQWVNTHRRGEPFYVPDVLALEDDGDDRLRSILEPQGIKSMISIPMNDGDELVGFVGFDSVRTHHVYTGKEIKLLQLFALMLININKRKRLDEEWMKSDERFRQVAEQDRTFFWEIDMDGLYTYVSPIVEEVLGYRPEELIGKKHFYDLAPPEDREEIKQLGLTVALKGDSLSAVENRMITKDGREIWVSSTVIPLRGKRGELLGSRGSDTDITELKKAREDYENLFNQTLDGVALHEMIYDENGAPADYRFLDVNPAFEQMTGLKAQDIIGRTVLEVLPATEPYWIEKYGSVALTGEPMNFENYSGEIGKYFSVTAFRPAPGQFACIFQDVTDRKLAEEELRRFKTIADKAVYGEAIADLNGNLVYLNRFFANIHGYETDELTGKNLSVLHSQEQMADVRKLTSEMLRTGVFKPVKVWHIHRDGTEFPMLMSGVLLKNEKGEPEYLATTAVDMTSYHKSEEAVRKSLEEKNILLSEIHHRVKNNMAVISSLLALQSDFSEIKVNPDHLIRDLQARVLSMGSVHELVYQTDNFAEISAVKLVRRIFDQLKPIYESPEKTVVLQIDAGEVMLNMNKSVPFSLFVNEAFTNSFKHAFTGKTSGRIDVAMRDKEGHLNMRIRDNGTGVSEIERLKIPSSFGYTIIHGLIGQLGGELTLSSPADGGLKIEVRFPLK